MRYSIRLSYDGSTLSGWQKQDNAPSVQQELSKALSTLCGCPVETVGAGRTDAGVNAINYIAHFDVPGNGPFDAAVIAYKLNAILPKNIVVHEISPAAPVFHSRFDAISREYHYFIHFKKDPFAEKYSYRCRYRLDVEKMNRAAAFLIGTKDFSCFEKTGGNNATSVCSVTEALWEEWTPSHVGIMGYEGAPGDYLVFRIRANRFLRNMVRAVVGSLVDVGRGKRTVEWFSALVASGTRSDAGESVPGHALFLSRVDYPGQEDWTGQE